MPAPVDRTPMQQVTHLRLRHAASLLTSGDDKLEVIADAVGYANPFVFSNTFKKWTGWRPSEYRARKFSAATPGEKALDPRFRGGRIALKPAVRRLGSPRADRQRVPAGSAVHSGECRRSPPACVRTARA